jgi:hypothetical protein
MLMHSIYHVILFTFCEGLRLNTILSYFMLLNTFGVERATRVFFVKRRNIIRKKRHIHHSKQPNTTSNSISYVKKLQT